MLLRRHNDAHIDQSLQCIAAGHRLPNNDRTGVSRTGCTRYGHLVLIKSAESPTRPIAVLIGKRHIHRLTVNGRVFGEDVNHERQIAETVAIVVTHSKRDIIGGSRVVIFRPECQRHSALPTIMRQMGEIGMRHHGLMVA